MSYGTGEVAPGVFKQSKKLIEDARKSVAIEIFNELEEFFKTVYTVIPIIEMKRYLELKRKHIANGEDEMSTTDPKEKEELKEIY